MYKQLKKFFELVKFEHTLFALPFAYIGALLARGDKTFGKFFWITLAMAGARTAGMSLNRLIDLRYDSLNPRTKERVLPSGRMSLVAVYIIIAVSIALFVFSAMMLNKLCLLLSPAALLLLFTYSYLKRFTWLSHVFLGLILACAPVGGFIAITGFFEPAVFVLGAAVIFWVAGFDVIYACQDYEFDRDHKLHSMPVKFGVKKALIMSSVFHVITGILLLVCGMILGLNVYYYIGVGICAGLLVYEHWILTEDKINNINKAFFVVNAWVSVIMMVFVVLDKLMMVI